MPRWGAALYGAEDLVKVNGHFFAKFNRHYDTLIILAF